MSRPSHAIQQEQVDHAMAAMPSARWRWLFTPDPRWLASVNTTALRTVNAIRMFVGVTILFAVMFVGVVGYALTRCGIRIDVLGHKVFQLMPPPGKLSVADWRLCEESLATARMLDFASALFTSYALLLAGMAGIALGAMAVKRFSDTEHRVEVEKAKKAPIIVPPVTGEHQALPPIQQTVNVGDDAVAAAQAGEGVIPEPKPKPRPTGDARVDDESGS